jgi:hypothetical protein
MTHQKTLYLHAVAPPIGTSKIAVRALCLHCNTAKSSKIGLEHALRKKGSSCRDVFAQIVTRYCALCHARLFFPFDSASPRQFIDIAHIRLQPRPLAALPHANAPAKEEAAVVLTGLQVQGRISLLSKLVLDVGSDQFLVSRVHLYTFVHDIPVCPCVHLTYFHDSCKRYRLVLMEY